jgi:FAD:protein FMN transferase
MEFDCFRSMSTSILLASEGPDAQQSFAQVRSFIDACERRFTRFSTTSELVRMNQSAGDWFRASPEMFSLLQTAVDCYLATDGLFDPTVLPDLEPVGTIFSLDEMRAPGINFLPTPHLYNGKARLAFDKLEFRPENLTIRLPLGMRIDLGGIAKGWIADQAAHRLEKFTSTCAVNAGGDLFLVGIPDRKPGWEIVLEDPRNPNLDLITLTAGPCAVSTASVARRMWLQNDHPSQYLIDPRSGEPAETHWLSVTVFGPTGAIADAFAKAILIGGPEFARTLIRKYPQIYYLAVDRDCQVCIPENESIYAPLA